MVLADLALLSLNQLAPLNTWVALALFLPMPWAIRSRCLPAIHLSVLLALMGFVPRLELLHCPHLVLKAALVLPYFLVVACLAPLRHSLEWLRKGSMESRAWGLIVLISLLALAGDWGWAHFVNPNLSRYGIRLVPAMAGTLLPVYAVGFAAANALIEEIIWRGVMMTALDAVLGAGWLALALQALQFGIAHFRRGFPNGWLGLAMTAFFGAYMGLIRRYSKGLLACWIAHAVADLIIICLVIHFIEH